MRCTACYNVRQIVVLEQNLAFLFFIFNPSFNSMSIFPIDQTLAASRHVHVCIHNHSVPATSSFQELFCDLFTMNLFNLDSDEQSISLCAIAIGVHISGNSHTVHGINQWRIQGGGGLKNWSESAAAPPFFGRFLLFSGAASRNLDSRPPLFTDPGSASVNCWILQLTYSESDYTWWRDRSSDVCNLSIRRSKKNNMFSVLPLEKRRRRFFFLFCFFQNGRRTQFPKQPASLFFYKMAARHTWQFSQQMEKLMRESKNIKCDISKI